MKNLINLILTYQVLKLKLKKPQKTNKQNKTNN